MANSGSVQITLNPSDLNDFLEEWVERKRNDYKIVIYLIFVQYYN